MKNQRYAGNNKCIDESREVDEFTFIKGGTSSLLQGRLEDHQGPFPVFPSPGSSIEVLFSFHPYGS